MRNHRLLNITYENFVEIAKNKRCICFGAGYSISKIIKNIENDISIDYIVDSDFWKWGQEIDGYEVRAINQLWKEDMDSVVILITAKNFTEIEEMLLSEGLQNYYIYVLFFEHLIEKYDSMTINIQNIN